jgi:hypothetical protein
MLSFSVITQIRAQFGYFTLATGGCCTAFTVQGCTLRKTFARFRGIFKEYLAGLFMGKLPALTRSIFSA